MLYIVMTLNGRGIRFNADRVIEYDDRYIFYQDGEVVGEFLIKGICGYCKFNEEEYEEYDDEGRDSY